MIDRDLFEIFPDLPWRRIRRPNIRRLERLPKPPVSRFHGRHERRETEHDALRRIWIIAQNARRQTGPATPRGRAIARIIEIASGVRPESPLPDRATTGTDGASVAAASGRSRTQR